MSDSSGGGGPVGKRGPELLVKDFQVGVGLES